MHTNQIYLTGELKYPTFYAPGDKKKDGSAAKYPFMGARLTFQDVVYHQSGSEVVLPRQEMWLTITPPKRGQELDVAAGRQWKQSIENGWKYATLLGGVFINDKKTGLGRVRVSYKSIRLSVSTVAEAT